MVRKIWDTEVVTLETLFQELKIWATNHWDTILFLVIASLFSLVVSLS